MGPYLNSKRHVVAVAGIVAFLVVMLGLWIVLRTGGGAADDLSPFARKVLKMGRVGWVCAESRHFICYASDASHLAAIQNAAEFAYARAVEFLPGATGGRKGRIFSVDEEMWARVLRKADRRRDGLAIQSENEIFVMQSGSTADVAVRIAHEVVHYRVWQLWGSLVPVWLDEGLAGCLGWDIAEAYRLKMGWQLSRRWGDAPPPVSDLAKLMKTADYPAPGPEAEAFYRQSEALVRAIARNIGYGKLHHFVAGVTEETLSWDAYLRDRFGFSEYDFRWLAEEYERNLTGKEDD
jgi:hypothetical protein